MAGFMNFPIPSFVGMFLVLWLSARAGAWLRRRYPVLDEAERAALGIILPATLTLLALIIGFSFSMAASRYDQRKQREEEEANAIGTEYYRAGLLPTSDGARVRSLLKRYLDLRVQFYTATDPRRLAQVEASTPALQQELWAAVATPAVQGRGALGALVVSGMNDVLNSQGYTQASWWNRIPIEAWALMIVIAISANILIGLQAPFERMDYKRLWAFPLIVAITFLLIADLDSPRRGLINVQPLNLLSLSEELKNR